MKVSNYLPEIEIKSTQDEIMNGLRVDRRYILSKFFYDQRGSELFKEITQLDAYYPTRTEMEILRTQSTKLVSSILGRRVVELGSGDASKISILFESLAVEDLTSSSYYPIDVSEAALLDTAKSLKSRFPTLKIEGIVADFTTQLDRIDIPSPKTICFFGSTLGNFEHDKAKELLRCIGDSMRPGDELLLGLDRLKDPSIILRAYNDPKGVTASFNRNILNHVNRLVGADFNPLMFEHEAIFNAEKERIEMYLISNRDQLISGKTINPPIVIKKGDALHTENSHKYSAQRIEELISSAGLSLVEVFSDDHEWFSLIRLSKQE